MSEHTPGTWTYSLTADEDTACNFVVHPAGFTSPDAALLEGMLLMDDETNAANARLIAAAPDLLAACETLLGEIGLALYLWADGDALALDPRHHAVADAAHAAIAKARGEVQP